MTRLRSTVLTLLAFLAANASLYAQTSSDQRDSKTETPVTPSIPSIVVTTAIERTLVDRVLASGSIRAVEVVSVSPLVEGLPVQSLNADIGDRVEAGNILATLDADTLNLQKSQLMANLAKARAGREQNKAQLMEAQANASEANRVRERSRQLADAGSMSSAQAAQAEALADAASARVVSAKQSIAVAQADMELANAQIDDINLRLTRSAVTAPVSGIISARNAKIGAIATGAGQPLFTLIRDGSVELVADVPETELLKLKVGQPTVISLAGSDETLDGNVRLIAPTVDPQTRLGSVHIRIETPGDARVGMYASAQIIVDKKQGLALPLTAITVEKTQTITRKVENGVVVFVPITTGIQDGRYIEVTSGLKAGEKVVAKAGAYVRDGDRVNPVAAPADDIN